MDLPSPLPLGPIQSYSFLVLFPLPVHRYHIDTCIQRRSLLFYLALTSTRLLRSAPYRRELFGQSTVPALSAVLAHWLDSERLWYVDTQYLESNGCLWETEELRLPTNEWEHLPTVDC